MEHFLKTYVSDTTAGAAVQTLFDGAGKRQIGRVYFRLTHGGEEYALAYAGTVDSTFADGSRTVCGDVCDEWTIHALRVGLCAACTMDEATEPSLWQTVTFGGEGSYRVLPAQWVTTDPIVLHAEAGQVLCVEMVFSSEGVLPCHEEIRIPTFVQTEEGFVRSPFLPVPVMVGVKREVSKRIAFLGDSITQGVGATPGVYAHWVARFAALSEMSDAYWNLGIGFARSSDAASKGTWLARAAHNDVVFLCLGVNDILQGMSAQPILQNLQTIAEYLKTTGCTVVVQSVPPFEFSVAQWGVWHEVNDSIASLGDAFFDNRPFLCEGDHPRYGGHPNDEGCAVWAQKLAAFWAEYRP